MATRPRTRPSPSDLWGPLPPHDSRALRRGPAHYLAGILEVLLLALGIVSLGYFAYVSIESRLYQAYENRELDQILTSRARAVPAARPGEPAPPSPRRDAPAAAPSRPPAPARTGSLVGRIEIPRLDVSAVIRAGSDARTLRLAVGLIPGTAAPGASG